MLVRGFLGADTLLHGNLSFISYYFTLLLIILQLFHEVLDAILQLYTSVVTLPTIDTPPSSRITDNPKYTPYFDDCIGALDGTHIAAYVSTTQQARYRNRKGTLSQNVLAVCDFNMQFVYV